MLIAEENVIIFVVVPGAIHRGVIHRGPIYWGGQFSGGPFSGHGESYPMWKSCQLFVLNGNKGPIKIFVLNGNKRPIRYESQNGAKPSRYNGNMVKIRCFSMAYCKKWILRTQRPETVAHFLLKKRPWHRCFPVNFAKFLRNTFS